MGTNDFHFIPRLLNGAFAAQVGAAIVFPLDLVKTRLQNQHIGSKGEREYKSMLDCFKKTYKNEGLRGLYRGVLVNLIWVGQEKGLKLAANDLFRYYLSTEKKLTLAKQAIAGGLAGVFQMLVSCPTELLKIQMQDSGRVAQYAKKDGGKPERLTAIGITKKLLKERGILGFYRGAVPTGLRDVVFAVLYFPLFSYMNDIGPRRPDGEAKFYWTFISGMVSGGFSAWSTTPFDVLKTRMQAMAKSEGQKQYTGLLDCFTHTLSTEGITAFFKGGACRIIVLAPLYAIAQMVYYFGVAEHVLGYEMQKSVR